MLINDCFDLFVFRSDCAVSKSGRRLLTCGFLPTVLSQRVHVGCLPMVSCRLCCLTKWTSAVYLWFRAVCAVSQSGRRLFTSGFVPTMLSHKVDVGCLPVVSCQLLSQKVDVGCLPVVLCRLLSQKCTWLLTCGFVPTVTWVFVLTWKNF